LTEKESEGEYYHESLGNMLLEIELIENDIALYLVAGFDFDGVKPSESDDNNITQLRSFHV
jgi:hypothetical protein